jgi:hypothetical protein
VTAVEKRDKGIRTPDPEQTALVSESRANPFSAIRQGVVTNTLTKTRAREGTNTVVNAVTGTGTVTNGALSVTIPEYRSMLGGLRTSTYKLLDALTAKFTESGAKSPTVSLPLDEYMSMCGLRDRKEARRQAEEDLETLFNLRLSLRAQNGKGRAADFADIRLCEAKGIRNGVISISFGGVFHDTLLGYTVMPYPPELWRLDARANPNSYHLLRRISEHKNMNFGKGNEDTISVATLLAAAPNLPTYDEVMAGNRNLTDRIVKPFERDMGAFSGTLTWRYCHSNGVPLTDSEKADFSYRLFAGLMVEVQWRQYPARAPRPMPEKGPNEAPEGTGKRKKRVD